MLLTMNLASSSSLILVNPVSGDLTPVAVFSLNKITDHPDYNSASLANDYSILTLASPVTFSSTMRPVCLPENTSNQYEGVTATVTGWGRLSSGGSTPSTLQEVNVNVISNAQCSNSYSGITSVNICAAAPGKDSCQGDSGGPLIAPENGRYAQIGVVSYGIGCALPEYPGVYARVTEVKDWILQNAPGSQSSNC